MPQRAQHPAPVLPGHAVPPPPGVRRPFPGWAVALFVVIVLSVIAAFAAFVLPLFILGGMVSTIASIAPEPPRVAPPTPSPAATTSMSEGRTGLRVVGVVPPPQAKGPWTGTEVIVAYLPLGAPVVPSHCRLTVNGRPQVARISWTTLSPAQPILIFSWRAPYPPGAYRFRVKLVAHGRKTAAAEWTYGYR